MGNLIDPRKIFAKLAAEIFPLSKKICATEFKFNGHYRFSLPKQKSIFCKKTEKFFHGVKILAKFYKSKNISQGKSK